MRKLGLTTKKKRLARENVSTSPLSLEGNLALTSSVMGKMKRNIIEMMVVHKNNGDTSTKNPNQSMLWFWDSGKIGGTPNKIFSLVIISRIETF